MNGFIPSGAIINDAYIADGETVIHFNYKNINFILSVKPGGHYLTCSEEDGGRIAAAREVFAFMDSNGKWASEFPTGSYLETLPARLNDSGTWWFFDWSY